jgi:hypothetical protein
VLGFDVLLSFFIAFGGTGSYIEITNQGYHNPIMLFLASVSFVNLILDGTLLSNKRKHPNLIDIRLCWLKCLFGCLGIFTILSFLYFGILSFTMKNVSKIKIDKKMDSTFVRSSVCPSCGAVLNQNSPYCPKCKTVFPLNEEGMKGRDDHTRIDEIIRRNEEEKEIRKKEGIKSQIESAKGNILKIEDSGNIRLISNFIKQYPNSNVSDQNFYNLKAVLAKKGIILTDLELTAVINGVRKEGELEWVKGRILYNNPSSSDECIKNYIEIFGKVNKNVQKERLIDYLVKILKDTFNYQGNLDSDLIRIEKQVELDRFENNLTGQASRNRITINDIDRIDGYEFERVLKELFKKMGYQVIHTPLSNDQGADLIVEKFGVKTVIQAKNWQDDVTNKGVQEVYAAIKHYDAQKAMVISSSGFTQSARKLARSNDVTLWDRSILAAMLDENPILRNE